MKTLKETVPASGLTVLFEPDESCNAIVDIVFVSGLGGHPVKTWQYTTSKPEPTSLQSPSKMPTRKNSLRDVIRKNSIKSLKHCVSSISLATTAADDSEEPPRQRKVLRKRQPGTSRSESKLLLLSTKEEPKAPWRAKSTSRLKLTVPTDEKETKAEEPEVVYWPADLLPTSCADARILTWGCQTLATKGRLLPAQNTVFNHASDLLHDLATLRNETKTVGRSLVLVTHSLGGVIVKEVLRQSEAASELLLKDIIRSLAGVVFFGCPHRDGEQGSIGDATRNMAGTMLGVNEDDEVLQDLSGANNSTALEGGRQDFVRLWNDYNFRVKTFQETLPITGETGVAHLLRRDASYFGDPRERCESVDAHHLNMCRFQSADDATYRSLSFLLLRFIHDEINRLRDLTPREQLVLDALSKNKNTVPAQQSSHRVESYPGTGIWLYDLPEFRAWHHRSSGGRNRILWIKGCPGSGKSVLLKSLRGRIERHWGPMNSNVVWSLAEGDSLNSVFFPGSHGQHKQRAASPAHVYRNLLAQLYMQDPRLRRALMAACRRSIEGRPSSVVTFDDAQLVTFFVDDYIDQKIETPTRRTFIFVDATDDCGVPYVEDLLYYLSQLAANSDYSICVATAHHPEIVLDNAIEVIMHQQNVDDILRYVSLHLMAEWEGRNSTVVRIGAKAAGCFLWAEIVVSILNAAIEEGATEELIEEAIADMPGDIDGLYEWLFSTLGPEERADTLLLMQWVLFVPEPLRLNDLRIAMQLSQKLQRQNQHHNHAPSYNENTYQHAYTHALHLGPQTSIRDLHHPMSEDISGIGGCDGCGGAFDSPSQFYSWVRSRSIGLLELQPQAPSQKGGVTIEPQGLRCVRFIHESVRSFFLSGRGFRCLQPDIDTSDFTVDDFADHAHFTLLRTCLSYLNVFELEPLGRHGRHGSGNKHDMAPLSPENSFSRKHNALDQRRLVMSSYPFLQYAVDHLVFHVLSPRPFRYHLPQQDLLRLFSANNCRIWRRWTALLGCSYSDAEAVLSRCAASSAKGLLDPVFGTSYRLTRIFRTLAREATAAESAPNPVQPTRRPPAITTKPPRKAKRPPVAFDRRCSRPPPPPSLPPPPPPPAQWSPASLVSPAGTYAETVLFSPVSPGSLMSPASIDSDSSTMRSPIFVK